MTEPVRVLHVDDDERFAGLTATALKRIDDQYVVQTADSADEGLTRLANGTVDCVVSDYEMPGRNGIEFLKAVRESHPDLPFVLFTGRGSEQVASEAISAGVTDYLQKDTGTEQFELLHNRIENAVSQYRAEAGLEQHRRVIETLIENLPAGILVEDESREVLTVNTTLLDLFDADGPTAAFVGADCEGLARGLGSVVERHEAFVESIEQRLDDREPVTGEEFVLTDGRIVERDYVPYQLPDGEANLWVYTDVTEDRETEQVLSGLFEQSFDGIAVHDVVTDDDGKPIDYVFRRVNDRFEELTGLDADEIVGKRATEVIQGIEGTDFIETYGEVALEGTPVRFEEYSEPLDRHYEIAAFPTKPDRFITIFSDITYRKERERELEKFKFFVEHTPDFMIILGPDLTVRYQSPISPAVDYEPRVVTAENPIEHIHPEDRTRTMESFERAMAKPDSVETAEFRAKDADEDWRWFETRTQNFVGTEPIDGVLVTIREVTDRKEKERQLQRQNERLDEFASVVSHDLRNPLNVANGRLDQLVEECESEHLDELTWALDRMDHLIDDVLTLAREGDAVGKTDAVELDELVSQCWNAVATTDATLVRETRTRLRADRSRLAQLLENLFRNAVEHGSTSPDSQTPQDAVEHGSTSPDSQTPQDAVEHGSTNSRSGTDTGDSITIRVGDLPDGFYVEDDGRGIPESEHDAVFRTGYSTTEEGTGFGLAIVEQIASAHGWTVDITTGETGGTRFEITGIERVD